MSELGPNFPKLVHELGLGEVAQYGEAFNLHFVTPTAFIKVTRSWVLPHRTLNEVAIANELYSLAVPIARPLYSTAHSFEDGEGRTRYVSAWERLPHGDRLEPHAATALAADWIVKLRALPPPTSAAQFQLDDFLHAVHVRLDNCAHPYAGRIVGEVERLTSHPAYHSPSHTAFMHGDLHNDNLLFTTSGVRIIDWESACVGPAEWDAAQNLRYCDPAMLEAQTAWWATKNVDMEKVKFYYHVRTLSSLSHLVATGVRPPMYYRALAVLGWPEI